MILFNSFIFVKRYLLTFYAHLLTRDTRISVSRRSKYEVVEHRSVRGDPDPSPHHHRDLELVPILVPAAKRALNTNFRIFVLRIIIAGIEIIPEFPCPRSLCFYVARQKILVRRRGQRKRMKLVGSEGGAGETHPLSRQVFQVRRPIKLDLYYVRG